jgi:hypothetical protein
MIMNLTLRRRTIFTAPRQREEAGRGEQRAGVGVEATATAITIATATVGFTLFTSLLCVKQDTS